MDTHYSPVKERQKKTFVIPVVKGPQKSLILHLFSLFAPNSIRLFKGVVNEKFRNRRMATQVIINLKSAHKMVNSPQESVNR